MYYYFEKYIECKANLSFRHLRFSVYLTIAFIKLNCEIAFIIDIVDLFSIIIYHPALAQNVFSSHSYNLFHGHWNGPVFKTTNSS